MTKLKLTKEQENKLRKILEKYYSPETDVDVYHVISEINSFLDTSPKEEEKVYTPITDHNDPNRPNRLYGIKIYNHKELTKIEPKTDWTEFGGREIPLTEVEIKLNEHTELLNNLTKHIYK